MITFTTEPSGVYPAYNDSYIVFRSDIANVERAEITLLPSELFPRSFTIYPNSEGVFVFNLKEVVKTRMSSNFVDSKPYDSSFFGEHETMLITQQLQINVVGDVVDSRSAEYLFCPTVKQLGDVVVNSMMQLTSHSANAVDYYMTYSEGYPFAFDVMEVAEGAKISFRNKNTSKVSEAYTMMGKGSLRVTIDNGEGVNWTISNYLPLIEGLNYIEMLQDGLFVCNIWIKKIERCSGVQLKWRNENGGYSYWLFDRFFNVSRSASNQGNVYASEFSNIDTATNSTMSIGKDGSESVSLRSKFDAHEFDLLKSLITSPYVQMLSTNYRELDNRYVGVQVSGSISRANKRNLNDITITVSPTVNTVTM